MTQSIWGRRALRALAPVSLSLAALAFSPVAQANGEVNIYSYREPQLIDPLIKAFTEKTGIKANVVYAGSGLNERLAAEGRNSPADLLFTVDIGRLSEAKTMGLTQPVKSSVLEETIPASYRDPEGHWFGLTLRSRVIYASKERVQQDSITYEELADPKWKGRICSRSGQHAYNVSLIASMIAHKGEEEAEKWLRGVKENLAHKPAGGDREQARDVYSGKCDLAIGNTYYVALMLKNPEQKAWAESIKVLFPNADDRGSHVNISGMALAKHAPNKDNAIKLMEYLASPEAQGIYAQVNNEYPISPEVSPSEVVQSWGKLNPDKLPLDEIARLRKKASELVDKVDFDAGPSS
ncbi:MAG TPA: Fe(3+) ABC transporter substrate-binding protein [Hyphomicrobiaceae bacterium]|jgi:iron(III) transport system substrate-binding protein|nr:Fe(3+) ABC transporter substrate-binding protein [Hyphomicrobiaceae bacterium]